MRNCFIPGCDQLCRGVAKRKMFSAPKDKECFNAWLAVLPKVRTFKLHDKVCERHFNKEDICTTYDNVINGLVYKIERGRARLGVKAVPCRNLETNIVPTSRRTQNSRKVLKVNPSTYKANKDNIAAKVKKEKEQIQDVEEEQHLEIEEVHDFQEISSDEGRNTTTQECALAVKDEEHLESIEISEVNIQELFESLYDDIYEVVLPNTLWGVHRCPERSAIFFSYVDPSALRTTKMVTINSQGQAKILLGNRLLNEDNLVVDINSAETLSDVIAQIDEMKLCPKVFEHEFCEVTLKDTAEMCTACLQGSNE